EFIGHEREVAQAVELELHLGFFLFCSWRICFPVTSPPLREDVLDVESALYCDRFMPIRAQLLLHPLENDAQAVLPNVAIHTQRRNPVHDLFVTWPVTCVGLLPSQLIYEMIADHLVVAVPNG